MKSVLSGKYLMFGFSNGNDKLYNSNLLQHASINLARAASLESQLNEFQLAFLD